MPTNTLISTCLCLAASFDQEPREQAPPLAPVHQPVHRPPSGCLAYAEWRDPDATAALFAEHAVLEPLLRDVLEGAFDETSSITEVVGFLRRHFAGSVQEKLDALAGDGLALWVTLDESAQPVITLALVANESEVGAKRTRAALDAIEAWAESPGALATASETFDGGEVWAIGDELFVLGTGTNTYITQSRRALDPLITPRRNVRGRRALERLVEAHTKRAAGLDAFVWLDFGAVGRFASLAGAPAEGPAALLGDVLALPRNPRAQSLLGPGISHIATAESLSLGLVMREQEVLLSLFADGVGDSSATMPTFAPSATVADSGANGGHALLYRPFATVLRDHSTSFDARDWADIAEDIAQFESLSGLSLAEDLLPHVSPWLEVVSRTVPFAASLRPELELPGAALIVKVTDTPGVGLQLDKAFEGLVAMANKERAGSGQSQLVLASAGEGERTWTAARPPPPSPDEARGIWFNLQPAAALVGDRWILASHEELLIDLLDEVHAGRAKTAVPEPVEEIRFDGRMFAGLTAAQLEALSRALGLDEGMSREETEELASKLVWLLERANATARVRYEPTAIAIGLDLTFRSAESPR